MNTAMAIITILTAIITLIHLSLSTITEFKKVKDIFTKKKTKTKQPTNKETVTESGLIIPRARLQQPREVKHYDW